VIESLRIGAEEMLASEVPFDPEATMLVVDVPGPAWIGEGAGGQR